MFLLSFNQTCAVCPFFFLSLERSTPLKFMLWTNNTPCSSSPQAPIIPLEIPNPLLSPRTVFATLPPAKVLTYAESSSSSSSSWHERTWIFTSLSIFFQALQAQPTIMKQILPNNSTPTSCYEGSQHCFHIQNNLTQKGYALKMKP